ncbi:MAG: anti-sigma factor [Ilumatobacteraceae bacterium]
MNGIDIHQLAAAYALDAVDERERAEFEAHYPTCAVCRPEVAGFREALSHVAAASATAPPASLKASVMAEISTTRQLSPLLRDGVVDLAALRQRRARMLRVLTVAAAVVLVGVGAFVVGRRSHNNDGYASAAAEIISRPDTRMIDLQGPASGSFKVAWSPSADRAVVIGNGLGDPGAGKAYELWRIDDSGAHAMRLLDKADGGQVRKIVAVGGAPSKWAVTVEPAGGVDAPTGDVIFSGSA